MKTPPWDSPCWLEIDLNTLLANLEKSLSVNSTIDIGSVFLEKAMIRAEPEFIRLGVKGIISRTILTDEMGKPFQSALHAIYAPPLNHSRLQTAIRNGYSVVLGSVSEAILVSNIAQSSETTVGVLLRLRSSDVTIDSGSTGILSMLEIIGQLPLIRLTGFMPDRPFECVQDAEGFMRALNRLVPENRNYDYYAPGDWMVPKQLSQQRIIGPAILGLHSYDGHNFPAAVSLEAWGCPAGISDEKVITMVELGCVNGFSEDSSADVFVEESESKILKVSERYMLIETLTRPTRPAPWRVHLAGLVRGNSVQASNWECSRFDLVMENLGRQFPVFIRNKSE